MSSKQDDKTAASATPATDARIQVPEGDVLLRRIAGPDGVHANLGRVKLGRLYTVEFPLALRLTEGEAPEFEAVYIDVAKQLKDARPKTETKPKG